MSTHIPRRPSWTCVACSDAWPCGTRRKEIGAEFMSSRTSVIMYLTGYYIDASLDLPNRPAGHLHRQFLGWLNTVAEGTPSRPGTIH